MADVDLVVGDALDSPKKKKKIRVVGFRKSTDSFSVRICLRFVDSVLTRLVRFFRR